MNNSLSKALGLILAIPVVIILLTVFMISLGLFGYAVGWSMELIASPLIYKVLEVVPTQPFSEGDFPKMLAIISALVGTPALKSIGGLVNNDEE